MNYKTIKTDYPVIDAVIKFCEPRFQEIVDNLNRDLLREGKDPLTENQVDSIFISCTFNLVKSMYNYVEKTDALLDTNLAYKRTGFIIETLVIRGSKLFDLVTDVIIAGGYNIQCAHYRYITKTQLPRIHNSTALTAIQKIMRKMSEVEKIEKKIQENTDSINNFINVRIPEQEVKYKEHMSVTHESAKVKFMADHPESNSCLKGKEYSDFVERAVEREVAFQRDQADSILRFWIPTHKKDIKNLTKRNILLAQKLLEFTGTSGE